MNLAVAFVYSDVGLAYIYAYTYCSYICMCMQSMLLCKFFTKNY